MSSASVPKSDPPGALGPPVKGEGAARPAWRDAWPIPVMLVGVALVALGLATLVKSAPGPDFKGVLSDAEALIERQEYGAALDLLNGPIGQNINDPRATADERGLFHALRGDAVYLGHRSSKDQVTESAAEKNNEAVIEEYEKAAHLDEELLTDKRRGFLAQSLLDLGRIEAAVEEARHLPAEMLERRHRLLKEAIRRAQDGTPAGRELAQALMNELLEDRELPEADRVWVIEQQAREDLMAGKTSEVIDRLLTEVQRVGDLQSPEAGELLLLLGRAYMETGQLDLARQQLAQAERVLLPGDARRGMVDAMLARILQARASTDEARDRFATVVERFPGTDAQALSLLGLAETEADLGRFRESIDAYAMLVRLLPEHSGPTGVPVPMLDASISQRQNSRFLSGDLEFALAFAQLNVEAFPQGQAPAEAVKRLAETHRALAERTLGADGDDLDLASRLREISPEDLEKARENFQAAGDQFSEHVRKSMINEPEVAAASLWSAADAFDRAGNQRKSIELFTQFVQNYRTHPRFLEAQYRLARCFQALSDFKTATSLFEDLVRDNQGTDEAFRSFVPLAQCYLLSSMDGEAEKAEALLLQVLNGRTFGPESPQFRRALVELAQMYTRIGRYPQAIERLTEAIERYPQLPERVRLEFDLADSNRLSAAEIGKQLQSEAMPISERTTLESLRVQRLRAALELYEFVRGKLEGAEPGSLSPVQALILRNASFYRADCLYDLQDFDGAIRLYDAAAQRYADDPASLVAMIQIINCYTALGKFPEARTAQARARLRLKELPDSAWEGAFVPMNRGHWERWLESSHLIEQAEARSAMEP